MSDADIMERLSELDTLTLTCLGEAGGDSRDGSSLEERVAVSCVIRNRVREPRRYGDSYKAVCLKRWQFSCWNIGDPNRERLIRMAYLMVTGQPLMDTLVAETRFFARGVVEGVVLDRVKGANHYVTTALLKQAPPAWAFSDPRRTLPIASVATVGSHTFFRL